MTASCPSRETLRQLLEDQLSTTDRSAAANHLNGCRECQSAADQLLEGLESLLAQVPRQPRPSQPGDEIDEEFLRELRNLSHEPAHENPGTVVRLPRPSGDTRAFGDSAAVTVHHAASEAHDPWLGRRIGEYLLVERIGLGGFGFVYRAEQHKPLRRTVAVKLLKPGMHSDVIARFDAERQTLALMDDPHIARVLDAGATEDGRPYFVMELVDGQSITGYCAEHRLTVRQRLELFATVCRAVQHAHQKGVIHRDLKPSNVLVAHRDGRPHVKVIDFGIAKALNETGADASLTATGQLIGTPLYMSPEQASHAASVDTRSDVYSLGALLYELLTGTTPFDKEWLTHSSLWECLRVIREEEPPRPSARLAKLADTAESFARSCGASARELIRTVRSDLDWIVHRALEKDRDRRYESAGSLARDVQRVLDHKPAEACPPSRWYRLRKYIRRNRVMLGTMTAVFAALLAGTAVAVSQALRAENKAALAIAEGKRADEKARLAEAVVDKFYTDFAEIWARNQPGMGAVQKAFLESAVKFYEEVSRETSADPAARQKVAEAHRRLGGMYRSIGDRQKAMAAFTKAIESLTEIHRSTGGRRDITEQLATARIDFGFFLMTQGEGHWPLAERQYRGAVELAEPLHKANPTDPQLMAIAARARHNLGLVLEKEEDKQRAFQAALGLKSKLVERFPGNASYLVELAISHQDLAGGARYPPPPLRDEQDRKDREEHYRTAIRLFDQVRSLHPGESWYRFFLATVEYRYGMFLSSDNRYPDAIPHLEAARRDYTRLREEHPDVLDYRKDLQKVLIALGEWHLAQGDRSAAEPFFREAIATYDSAQSRLSKAGVEDNNLAWHLATCPLEELRDAARAVKLAESATRIAPDEGSYWNTLGVAQIRAGSFQAAVTSLEKSLELTRGGVPIDWDFLAIAHWNLGHKEDAVRWYRKAEAGISPQLPAHDEARRFHAEAGQVLGLSDSPAPAKAAE